MLVRLAERLMIPATLWASKSRKIRICSSSRPFPLGSRDNLSCWKMSTRVVQLHLQVSHNTG
jgi:hypothetical protein